MSIINTHQLECLDETFNVEEPFFYSSICSLKYICFTDGYSTLSLRVCPITSCSLDLPTGAWCIFFFFEHDRSANITGYELMPVAKSVSFQFYHEMQQIIAINEYVRR